MLNRDDGEDIYLSMVNLGRDYQGQGLCKQMVTYCLQRAYQIIRQGNEELGLPTQTLDEKKNVTGDVYISTNVHQFEAAKSYIYHSQK